MLYLRRSTLITLYNQCDNSVVSDSSSQRSGVTLRVARVKLRINGWCRAEQGAHWPDEAGAGSWWVFPVSPHMVWWSNPVLLTQSPHHLSDKHMKDKLWRNSGRKTLFKQTQRDLRLLKRSTLCCVVLCVIWLAPHLFWMSFVTR